MPAQYNYNINYYSMYYTFVVIDYISFVESTYIIEIAIFSKNSSYSKLWNTVG